MRVVLVVAILLAGGAAARADVADFVGKPLADVRDRRLPGLVERAGDTLQLLGRYAEAVQRFKSLMASTPTANNSAWRSRQ